MIIQNAKQCCQLCLDSHGYEVYKTQPGVWIPPNLRKSHTSHSCKWQVSGWDLKLQYSAGDQTDRHTPSQNPSKLTSEWEYMDKVCTSCIETNTMRGRNDVPISDVDKGYSGIYMTRLNIIWKFPFTLERSLCHRVLVNSVRTLYSELCYEDQTRTSSWVP